MDFVRDPDFMDFTDSRRISVRIPVRMPGRRLPVRIPECYDIPGGLLRRGFLGCSLLRGLLRVFFAIAVFSAPGDIALGIAPVVSFALAVSLAVVFAVVVLVVVAVMAEVPQLALRTAVEPRGRLTQGCDK